MGMRTTFLLSFAACALPLGSALAGEVSRVQWIEPAAGVDVVDLKRTEGTRRTEFMITLANATAEQRAVYMRIHWLDAHQPKLAKLGEPWYREVIAAGQSRVVYVYSPVSVAGEFLLQMGMGGELETAQREPAEAEVAK
jgi:hypothetical protein